MGHGEVDFGSDDTIEHQRRGSRVYYSEQVVRRNKPNDVWTVVVKGWWLTKDAKRWGLLTTRDEYSRYILDLGALTEGSTPAVLTRVETCLERLGVPRSTRSDNGAPF